MTTPVLYQRIRRGIAVVQCSWNAGIVRGISDPNVLALRDQGGSRDITSEIVRHTPVRDTRLILFLELMEVNVEAIAYQKFSVNLAH